MKTLDQSHNTTKLSVDQKRSIGLLSIGTFLEYFDLMLYVHMAVLLNDLFFPKTDAHTAALLSAFAFSSSFVFRPISALLFGWIGDKYGRKHTVVITTSIMAISCVIMATLPTYDQIGISAAYAVTICRVLQSMSSMGEVIGAKLYLTETIDHPHRYPTVTSIQAFASLGGVAALGTATLVSVLGIDWRNAFWMGATIAIVGAFARTKLRETPEFANAKIRLQNILSKVTDKEEAKKIISKDPVAQQQVNKKSMLALFLMDCTWPVCFYFAYGHCGHILKQSFGYTPEQIIYQNLIVSFFDFFGFVGLAWISYYVYPLFTLRIRTIIFFFFALLCPFFLDNATSANHIIALQAFVIFMGLSTNPASPVIFKRFPIFKRFTYTGLAFGLARAIMYLATSFGMVYLTKFFGNYGLLIIFLPTIIGFAFGVIHFEKLDRAEENNPGLSGN